MLERVIGYLRSHGVPFRLSSHPSPEPAPGVVVRLPPGGLMLETHLVLIGGQPAIACTARGAQLNLPRFTHEIGAVVIEGGPEDLPPAYAGVTGPLPPLGGAFGALTVIDEAVSAASAIAFAVFSSTDIVEIPYDEFSRLERPRIASFAIGGELPESEIA